MQLLLLTALVVVGYINLSLLALFLEMKSAALPGAAAAVALIAVLLYRLACLWQRP